MTNHVLPIDFEPTPRALETNLQSRKLARAHLEAGGVVIVFPSGGIATTPRLFSREATEEPWAPLVGQLVRRTRASVLPVFFYGQNSRLFQWASHISYAMRIALIFHEVRRRIGTRLDIVIGEVMDYEALQPHLPPKNLARHLQRHVYQLARWISS